MKPLNTLLKQLNANLKQSQAYKKSILAIGRGLRWDQISDNFPKHSNEYHQEWWTFKDHQGESWHEALERFSSTVAQLVDNSTDKNLMLVSHGGVIRLFVAKILSNSPKPSLEISNTGITEIEVSTDQMKLIESMIIVIYFKIIYFDLIRLE